MKPELVTNEFIKIPAGSKYYLGTWDNTLKEAIRIRANAVVKYDQRGNDLRVQIVDQQTQSKLQDYLILNYTAEEFDIVMLTAEASMRG